MVTSLMVSFRSSSSYDRWYEARKTWQALQATCRKFTGLVIVALPPLGSGDDQEKHDSHVDRIEELCSLVVALPYAIMHHLRDEPGLHDELRTILPAPFVEAMEQTPKELRASPMLTRSTRDTKVEHSNATEAERAMAQLNRAPGSGAEEQRREHAAPAEAEPAVLPSGAPSNLPFAIIRTMHSYVNLFHTTNTMTEGSPSADSAALDAPTYGHCLSQLNAFTDQLTALERIRDTPIPLVLSIHLHLLLCINMLAIPLQLVCSLGLAIVPFTMAATFVFYGLDRAAEELSDPFGMQPNDLPLERFCREIRKECIEVRLLSCGSRSSTACSRRGVLNGAQMLGGGSAAFLYKPAPIGMSPFKAIGEKKRD